MAAHRLPQHNRPLSLFQQTLRDTDEEFYNTFPAARPVHDDPSIQQPSAFRLRDHQMPSPPSLPYAPDSPFAYQQAPMDSRHTGYAPFPFAVPSVELQNQPHQFSHLPLAAPAMHSLPSPGAFLDSPLPYNSPPSYHTPPQYPHQPAPSFATTPSPVHCNDFTSVSPPAPVPAPPTYHNHDINAVTPEHEPPFFVDQLPPHIPSIAPPRRNKPNRSQPRYLSPYSRPQHPTRRSGSADRDSMSIPSPDWPPSPPNTATFVNVMGHAAAASPVFDTSPASDQNGKRNPEKKPALACIFCRGRKIACGAPVKDGDGKTCNQCQRRSLRCVYPLQSRRGMRRKTSPSPTVPGSPSAPASKASRRANSTRNTKPNPKSKAHRKR